MPQQTSSWNKWKLERGIRQYNKIHSFLFLNLSCINCVSTSIIFSLKIVGSIKWKMMDLLESLPQVHTSIVYICIVLVTMMECMKAQVEKTPIYRQHIAYTLYLWKRKGLLNIMDGFCCLFLYCERILLCSSGWCGIHNMPALASFMLGIQTYSTMASEYSKSHREYFSSYIYWLQIHTGSYKSKINENRLFLWRQ
jgi:hypothetical protein